MHTTRKGFAVPLLIGIVAVVLVAVGGYYASRGPSAPQEGELEKQMMEKPASAELRLPFQGEGEKMEGDAMMKDKGAMMEGEMMKSAEGGSASGGKEEGAMMQKDEGMMMQKEEGATMQKEEGMMVKYAGVILAGKSAPLIDYNRVDYDAAIKSDKLVVLYFYANWCPICKKEVPELYAAFDALTTENVVGFRVNYNDSETDANEEALAREFGVAYQHTKVFLKNGVRVLKAPDSWEKARYLSEISKALSS